VAQLGDQGLDVGGDHRLVLDDQDVGGQFRIDLRLRLGDQLLHLREIGAEDLGGLRRREAFEGREQEGLARARRDAHQSARGVVGVAFVFLRSLELCARRAPDGVEHVIERDAGRHAGFQRPFPGGERFQGDTDVVVAGRLVSGKRACVSTHIG
jgi:hypothetical protein